MNDQTEGRIPIDERMLLTFDPSCRFDFEFSVISQPRAT